MTPPDTAEVRVGAVDADRTETGAQWLPGDYALWRFGGRPKVHIVMGIGEFSLRAACRQLFQATALRHASEDEANARPCADCWEAM